MARITPPLTLTEIKKAKPKEKTYKLYDGGGLYLSIMPSGTKVWRFDYTDGNKKDRLTQLTAQNLLAWPKLDKREQI